MTKPIFNGNYIAEKAISTSLFSNGRKVLLYKKMQVVEAKLTKTAMEFSLNSLNSVTKQKLKIKKEDYRVGTHYLLWKRQRLYHSATEPQATEQILILNPIHASVIFQIL